MEEQSELMNQSHKKITSTELVVITTLEAATADLNKEDGNYHFLEKILGESLVFFIAIIYPKHLQNAYKCVIV